MKQVITLSAICFLFSLNGFAQAAPVDTIKNTSAPKTDEAKVFTQVEYEAGFPGGNAAWGEFLQKHLKSNIAEKNKAPKGRYQVIIKFIVSKDGTVINAEPETKHGYGMEEEVLRVINKSPKWIPAQQNGRNVNAYRRQPITFVVD